MGDLVGHALSVFMGFFAIMNPIANTPVFLNLTAADDPGTRRKVAARALTVTTEEDKNESVEAELEIAITSLAMPILAGPGTIATAMNFASGGGVREFVVTVVAFLALCAVCYVFFVSGERVVKHIGDNGVKVVTRLMGLILAVIGVQMLIHGIGGAVMDFQTLGVR